MMQVIRKREIGIKSLTFFVLTFVLSASVNAALVFDNGASIDSSNTSWSASTLRSYTIYDDFELLEDTNITGISFSIFLSPTHIYDGAYISVVDSIGGTTFLPSTAVIGSAVSNGLVAAGSLASNGFDIFIEGLDFDLSSGTYYLGISVPNFFVGVASGDSGFGSGLKQFSSSTNIVEDRDEHMVFSIEGAVSNVPVPASVWLFGSGLFGLIGVARRKKT